MINFIPDPDRLKSVVINILTCLICGVFFPKDSYLWSCTTCNQTCCISCILHAPRLGGNVNPNIVYSQFFRRTFCPSCQSPHFGVLRNRALVSIFFYCNIFNPIHCQGVLMTSEGYKIV